MAACMRVVAVVIVLVLGANVVRADDDGPKQRALAIGLSVGGTVLSTALIAAGTGDSSGAGGVLLAGAIGFVLLPSAGEWYAGQPFTWGMLVRVGGLVLIGGGLAQGYCDGPLPPGQSCPNPMPAIVGGVVVASAGAILDIALAPRAVARYNANHRPIVAPTILHPPSGPVPGVSISGRF